MNLHFRQYGRLDDPKQTKKHSQILSNRTPRNSALISRTFLIHMAELIVREILRCKKKDKATSKVTAEQ